MTCESAETYLHYGLDKPLTQAERVALDAHLESCVACRQEREAQRRLVHLADRWVSHTLASSDPGDAFNAQMWARLEVQPKRSRLSAGLPLAATLLLLAVLPDDLRKPAESLASPLQGLPHWLALNLLALPSDALALPSDALALPSDALALRLLPQTVLVSSWLSVLLLPAVGLNAVFCLYARQSALRRSVS